MTTSNNFISKRTVLHGESSSSCGILRQRLEQLKNHVQGRRATTIKKKLEVNKEREVRQGAASLRSRGQTNLLFGRQREEYDMLAMRKKRPLVKYGGAAQGSGDDFDMPAHQVLPPVTVLPSVDRIPKFTTATFVNRNHIMNEKSSVPLNSSDSEDDQVLPDKQEGVRLSAGEDYIFRRASEEFGSSDAVLNTVSQFLGVSVSAFQEDDLEQSPNQEGICLEKSLTAALRSFDNHFCRRCMVFNCTLHGHPQTSIYPREKQRSWFGDEDDINPCGDKCYLQEIMRYEARSASVTPDLNMPFPTEEQAEVDISSSEWTPLERELYAKGVEMFGENSCLIARNLLSGLKTCIEVFKYMHAAEASSSDETVASSSIPEGKKASDTDSMELDMPRRSMCRRRKLKSPQRTAKDPSKQKSTASSSSLKGNGKSDRDDMPRRSMGGREKLKSSHRIAKGSSKQKSIASSSSLKGGSKSDSDSMELDMPTRSMGRSRNLNSSQKIVKDPSEQEDVVDDRNNLQKNYAQCQCQSECGKTCPCRKTEICCEKYCGCSRTCRNRFKGCLCSKDHCRTQRCPCFAAMRECDPDICKNCWISCGDGSLGRPFREEAGQCENMKILLGEHKRILLGISDIAGWGAFVKDPVNKEEYLGEYTGELISHEEAETRGENYDKINRSYLFDLNNEYVVDAFRKGNKLKFANHSANPNCYSKIIRVGGDHKIGIFAKKPMEAGEEIVYDYGYKNEVAPEWAKKPEEVPKRGDSTSSRGRGGGRGRGRGRGGGGGGGSGGGRGRGRGSGRGRGRGSGRQVH